MLMSKQFIGHNLAPSLAVAIALVMMSLGTIAMMSWRTGMI